MVRAASHDDGRPLLTGVLVSHVEQSLRLVATDSYRMAMRDLAGTSVIPGEEDLLVPARALSELQRLPARVDLVGRGVEDKVGVAASANEITFWQGNVQISTRLLEGRYPDYKQLIPDHYPNRLHLGKETFFAALRRVQLLVRDNTTPVRLSMRQAGVDLSVQSQDVGDAAETVDGDYTGEDLVIAFNPSYLIDGVEAVTGDEVIVETADASRAATVHGAEDDAIPLPADARAGVLRTRPDGPECGEPPATRAGRLPHLLRPPCSSPAPEGTTVITGANGTGKTSVLEAHRLPRHAPLVPGRAHGGLGAGPGARRASAIVRAEVSSEAAPTLVEAEIALAGAAAPRVNRKPVAARKDLAAAVPAPCSRPRTSPSSAARPKGRRDLLDDALALLDAEGARAADETERVLRQRAALLRQSGGPAQRRTWSTTLDVWDQRLADAGKVLVAAAGTPGRRPRSRWWRGELRPIWPAPTGAAPDARPADLPALAGTGDLSTALAASRTDDLRRGVNTVGPHRDELSWSPRRAARPAPTRPRASSAAWRWPCASASTSWSGAHDRAAPDPAPRRRLLRARPGAQPGPGGRAARPARPSSRRRPPLPVGDHGGGAGRGRATWCR